MKKALILGLAITALNPLLAFAADDQYPAANFAPTVIYSDDQLIAQSSSGSAATTAAADDKYPAANFAPTVIYSDESAAHASAPAATSTEVDPNYPAYNFQPKVIYP